MIASENVFKEHPRGPMTDNELKGILKGFVEREGLIGKRTIAIIPDHTRTAPMGLLFRELYGLLARRPGALDFLIALGTHPPLKEAAIDRRLELLPGERAERYPNTTVYNHEWNNPDRLQQIGTISSERVAELSGGLMNRAVPVSVNRLIFDYETVLIVGPTFPHEVVGFSGGNKYLFPGISGQAIIDMFHWLGALITNPCIIGRKQTPVRAVVDEAASMIPVPRLCLSLVVDQEGIAGLYAGTPEDAWSRAADHSASVHIRRMRHPFQRVLSCAPAMYDDLWVGAKAVYKLEPVVADEGELIVYAPHIREVSFTHGRLIERIGYHVRDYFLHQMERFADIPGGVLAHATHVKGVGTYEGGVERPRMNVTLATGISRETCRRLNLGYRDPATIAVEEWHNREQDGIFYVPKAGETLFRLTEDPFTC